MKKPLKKEKAVSFLGWLLIALGIFIIWRTILQMIPVVYLLAAVITESPELIANTKQFMYVWFGGNFVFMFGVLVILIQKLVLNKKQRKRL